MSARAAASAGVRPIDTGTVRAQGSSAAGRTSTCAALDQPAQLHRLLLVGHPQHVHAGEVAHAGEAGLLRRAAAHDHAQPHESPGRRWDSSDHRTTSCGQRAHERNGPRRLCVRTAHDCSGTARYYSARW